ncbi:chondroitin sulfate proteoglycan, partial [Elysia marginata]
MITYLGPKMGSRGFSIVLFTVTLCAMKAVALEKKAIEASFYGESYVHSNFQDARQGFAIKLEFQTARPDGLLFLAVGKTDYMLVQLNAGIIETRTNLGSGEAVVFSARGVRLDDSKWHSVEITCNQGLVYLLIDGRGQGQSTTPGNFYELNIQLGVYIGGRGNLEKPFIRGSKRPYRGCLRGVIFNERNLLKDAQNAFHVSWTCDDEFTAKSDSIISLNDETSFVALPSFRIYPGSTGVLSCDVKTRLSDVLVLFNSGQGSTSRDFMAVELINGKPKLSMDKGSGVIEVALQTSMNDGSWHTLIVTISETRAKIQMDAEQNVTTFHSSGQNYLNLGHHLYIGGLGSEIHSQASKLGLSTVTGMLRSRSSLLGCVRNLSMNSVNYGFQEIQVSRFVDVGCRWEFPCSQNPCIETASCVEVGMKEFQCECGQASCVKSEFEQASAGEHTSSILSVRDIVVTQGGNAVINADIIQIKQEYKDYFLHKNVLFSIKDPPKMGRIEVYGEAQTSFTWSDFMRNSVSYHHYGEFTSRDNFVLEISADMAPFRGTATKKYDFFLSVQVTPHKPFQVLAPSGRILSISPGGRMRITTSVLNVETDTDPSMLTFHVAFLRETASYFEKSNSKTTVFTFKDIQNGIVWFHHREDAMVYTKINITDEVKHVTETVQLRFGRQDFDLKMKYNTGLAMSYGSYCLISSQNLTFLAGSRLEEVEVRYEITRQPLQGVLQLYTDTSSWIDVQNFTQNDIDSGKVRYKHFPEDSYSRSDTDSFRFRVSSKGKIAASQTFGIRFKAVVLTVEKNKDLVIHKGSFSRFSNNTLLVASDAENLDLNKIVYSLIRVPRKGRMYVTKQPISNSFDFDREPSLKIDDTFSQMDVNRGFVYYKYNNPSFKKDTDYIDLEVSYFGYTLRVRSLIVFSPNNSGVKLINNGLKGVFEGGMKVISKQNLFVEADKFKNFTFYAAEGPFHGSLNLVDPKTLTIIKSKISVFITSQLVSGKIAYKHDDSENEIDFFKFVATPNIRESASNLPDEIEQLKGEFHIAIRLRNDNPPKRVSNKVFHVVTGQVKTLSIHDLAFHDPDVDFDDSLLVYQRHTISNGDILDRITKESVFNFTQRDLTNDRLMFQHKGESISRVPILVSDGQYFSSSILEIRASRPFVQAVGSRILEVESGQTIVLDKNTIGVESNLDFKPEDVIFRLENTPKYGTLQVNGRVNRGFSLNMLVDGLVKYHHLGESVLNDTINFVIALKTFTTKAQVSIIVSPAAADISGPPEIVHNQVFSVKVRQTQVITDQYLKAQHKGYLPQDISYIITGGPQHGHLVIKGKQVREGSAPEFSQEDIDKGHVVYASDSPIHMSDKFTFDVGTEFESLRDMEFLIDVIPETAISTHLSVTIDEGGRFTFNTSIFSQISLISGQGKVLFNIEQTPMHGKVVLHTRSQDQQVRSFTYDDLRQKRVSYVHDDSESQSDIVAIKASPQRFDSHPGEILLLKVTVKPVNDQPPIVIVNSGLDLWSGSLALVTGHQLQAMDPDTSSADIQYVVTSQPTNGHLAFLSNTFRPINSFTQLDLDSEQVVFVHKEFIRIIQGFNRDVEVHFSFESFARYGWLWYKDEEFKLGQEFTQGDLNSHRLVYKHDDTDSTHDTFLFGIKILVPRAHDKENLSVGGLRFKFPVTIEPVNDNSHLLLTHHPKISVIQGSEVVVTQQNLTTVDLDTGPEDIEYRIVTQPDNGMLVLLSAPRIRVRTFTQLDINTLNLVFKHDGSSNSRGSVYLKVSDKKFTPTYANLDIEVQLVGIAVISGEHIPIVQGTSSITLTPENLGVETNGDRSKLEYLIVRKTHYGRLTKHNKLINSFSQKDLEQGRIQYTQNEDSQGSDIFELTIRLNYINVSKPEIAYLIEQKPLVKQGPLLAVDGSYVAITRASLDASKLAQLTNDDPLFSIDEGPHHGKIMMRQRQRREAGAERSFTAVKDFTFEDIIFTRIYYVPDRKDTRASQDNFTYILSATGVPPALGELIVNLDVDKEASGGITTQVGSTVSTNTNVGEETESSGEKDSATSADDKGYHDKNFSGATNKDAKSEEEQETSLAGEATEENNTVIIVVVVLILCLVLVVIVVVILYRRKHRAQQRSAKNFQPAAKPRPLISGPLQLEQPHAVTGHTVGGIRDEDNSSAPMLSSPIESHPEEQIALVSSSLLPGEGKAAPETYGLYVNTAHVKDPKESGLTQASNVSPDVTQVTTAAGARPDSESLVSEDTTPENVAIHDVVNTEYSLLCFNQSPGDATNNIKLENKTNPPEILEARRDLPINCDTPSHREIVDAIKQLNQGKAAGPDLIPPEALKADVDTTATFLCPLFAKVWTSGKYPIDWKEGHLVKIPKKGDLSR